MRFNPFKRGKRKSKTPGKDRKVGFGAWRIVLAGVIILAGLGIMYYGNAQGNVIIIVAGFFVTFGGIMLFLSSREAGGGRVLPSKKKLVGKANALIIRPDSIEFDYIKKPPGFQHRFINDGKWYSILVERGAALAELVLPDAGEDERYYEPREFSNPVTMPANQKLFEPRPSMMKTIAVGLMGLLFGGGIIGIIAMSGD